MPRERCFFMPETQKPKLGFCLLAGALAGFINGFFGAGGGMVLVPLLLWKVVFNKILFLGGRGDFAAVRGVHRGLCGA